MARRRRKRSSKKKIIKKELKSVGKRQGESMDRNSQEAKFVPPVNKPTIPNEDYGMRVPKR